MVRGRFDLIFAPATIDHLEAIGRKYHGLIRRTIDEQLSHTPSKKTRNRKPLERSGPYGATWELRFGPDNRFRVFYEIDTQGQAVWILAIGAKEGSRLLIGGEEFKP